jgi:hypothetical protein
MVKKKYNNSSACPKTIEALCRCYVNIGKAGAAMAYARVHS